jgi:hypothetical protein
MRDVTIEIPLDEIIRRNISAIFKQLDYILDEDKEENSRDVSAKYNFGLLKNPISGTQPATRVWREIQSQLLTTSTG